MSSSSSLRAEREAARLAVSSSGSVHFASVADVDRSSRATRGVPPAWRQHPRVAARGISMWGADDGENESDHEDPAYEDNLEGSIPISNKASVHFV